MLSHTQIKQCHSPNFEDRKGDVRPSYLIIHCTETQTAQDAHVYYMNESRDKNAGRISPHYMIDPSGGVSQYVDEAKRAWHAGLSQWDGNDDMNSHSIGIELVNLGSKGDFPPYPIAQLHALAQLSQHICERHNILPCNVLAHSDIAPERRHDPDHHFDWKTLAKLGVGAWPDDLLAQDLVVADILMEQPDRFRLGLIAYGYSDKLEFPIMLEAFHRHFYPEIFTDPNTDEPRCLHIEGARRLAALLRIKKTANT